MKTSTFLTYVGDQCGKAEEAIGFYTSIFPNSEIKSITKYAEGEPGGTPELIKYGVFILNGVEYKVSESNYNHAWSFTPGVSLLLNVTQKRRFKPYLMPLPPMKVRLWSHSTTTQAMGITALVKNSDGVKTSMASLGS